MSAHTSNEFGEFSELVASENPSNAIGDFYEKHFSLPGNPFPPSGIADATEENPPLDPDAVESIKNFIKLSYLSGQTHSMFITGDYGFGKTHTLRFIEHIVNTYMNKGDRSARAIYVERPRIEAHELNRTVLRSLGHDTVRKYVWFVIRGVLLHEMRDDSEDFQQLRNKLTRPDSTKTKGKLTKTQRLWLEQDAPEPAWFGEVFNPQTLVDYRDFLREFEKNDGNREQVRYYLVTCLVKAIGENLSIDLAEAFVALLLARDETSFASWEALVSTSKTKALLSFRAPAFLEFLLRIMQHNGIAYVYLLIDEFEEVPLSNLLTSRQRQDYLYTMREVFDKIRRGLAVVIAMTPAGLEAVAALATPVADRNHATIDLPPVELDEAVKLVQVYLHDERKASKEFKNIRKNELKPFSRELINYVITNLPPNVDRTPRNLIQFFHRLLVHAARNNITDITQQVAGDVLAEFGVMKPSVPSASRRR